MDGDIESGSESRVDNLQSVDGNIYVGRDVVVRRDVELVDGDIVCRSGVVVGGNINAIDGRNCDSSARNKTGMLGMAVAR